LPADSLPVDSTTTPPLYTSKYSTSRKNWHLVFLIYFYKYLFKWYKNLNISKNKDNN
jgi:hypothetical protein